MLGTDRDPLPGDHATSHGGGRDLLNITMSLYQNESLLANNSEEIVGDSPSTKREFFIANILVRIHFIIVMIRWTGLAPWEVESPFFYSLESTFLHKGDLPGRTARDEYTTSPNIPFRSTAPVEPAHASDRFANVVVPSSDPRFSGKRDSPQAIRF